MGRDQCFREMVLRRRSENTLVTIFCVWLALVTLVEAGEKLPLWVPEGYSITEVARAEKGRFVAYSLYADRGLYGIYVRDEETRLTTLIAPPDDKVIAMVLRRDFQLGPAKVQESDVLSMRWLKGNRLEVVYGVSLWESDVRFRRNDLKLTRIFECSWGPQLKEAKQPNSGLIPQPGYGSPVKVKERE